MAVKKEEDDDIDIEDVKQEEDNSFDMSDIPPILDFSSIAVDSNPSSSKSGHTNALSRLPPEAPINNNIAKWIAAFEPGITTSFMQFNRQTPHRSGQSMSIDPQKQIHFLEVSEEQYSLYIKKWLYANLERSHRAEIEPPEGLTCQLNLKLLNISTNTLNQTVLTFNTTVGVMSSRAQDQGHLRCTLPMIGRSYEVATAQGIQDLSNRLQTAGVISDIHKCISDLHSVLRGPQRKSVVPLKLLSIQPPTLSDLHLSVKLQPNPTCRWSAKGHKSYTYKKCHLRAQVTFSGSTWDNEGMAWKPIMAEDKYCPGSGESSFTVDLPTAGVQYYRLNEATSKLSDLFVLPMPFASCF